VSQTDGRTDRHVTYPQYHQFCMLPIILCVVQSAKNLQTSITYLQEKNIWSKSPGEFSHCFLSQLHSSIEMLCIILHYIDFLFYSILFSSLPSSSFASTWVGRHCYMTTQCHLTHNIIIIIIIIIIYYYYYYYYWVQKSHRCADVCEWWTIRPSVRMR